MAILKTYNNNFSVKEFITDPEIIKDFMNHRGILFEQWEAKIQLENHESDEKIFKAYEHKLSPFMKKHGYINADVVNVHPDLPNKNEIRQKFLSEHTHSEDEIRFFVDGEGAFYFHFEHPQEEVFCLICQKGDFISVPKGVKHWFDLAPKYFVKAIRIFQTKEGWIPEYTKSGKEKMYLETKFLEEQRKDKKNFLLFDIEGTTTDIDFVHKILFPYSFEKIERFILDHQTDEIVSNCIKEASEIYLKEQKRACSLSELIVWLKELILADRKFVPLKVLQGLIWKEAYLKGEFVSHVYEDVPTCWRKWKSQGISINIYSSGSIEAQKLLFQHTSEGNLSTFIDHFFDTQVGSKKESSSYQKIVQKLGTHPHDVVFFSDVEDELKAAQMAGLEVYLVQRKHFFISSYTTIKSLEEYSIEK